MTTPTADPVPVYRCRLCGKTFHDDAPAPAEPSARPPGPIVHPCSMKMTGLADFIGLYHPPGEP